MLEEVEIAMAVIVVGVAASRPIEVSWARGEIFTIVATKPPRP